jgi:transcription elongation GreA/GreB family factor
MKDREDAPEPIIVRERSQPHPITPSGLKRLREQLAETTDQRLRNELEERIESAIVAAPPKDQAIVAFGATVTVEGASRGEQQFKLVGEDEVDIASGEINVTSPLGETLLGARVGDTLVWHRPAGDKNVTVLAINYDALKNPPRGSRG